MIAFVMVSQGSMTWAVSLVVTAAVWAVVQRSVQRPAARRMVGGLVLAVMLTVLPNFLIPSDCDKPWYLEVCPLCCWLG